MSQVQYGYTLAFIGMLVLSTDTLLIKLVSTNITNIWIILFYRYLLCSISCFLYNFYDRRFELLTNILDLGVYGLIGSFIMITCNICFASSIFFTTVSNTLAIFSISAVMTSFFSFLLLKQHMKWWTTLTLVIVTSTIIGIISYDIENGENSYSKESNSYGYIMATIAMFANSSYFTLLEYIKQHYPDKMMVLIPNVSSIGTFVISALVIGISNEDFTIEESDYKWMCLQGLFVLPIAFITLTLAPKYITGTESNMIMILETVLGPLWVFAAGIEETPLYTIIGLVLLIGFLLFNSIMTIKYEKRINNDLNNENKIIQISNI